MTTKQQLAQTVSQDPSLSLRIEEPPAAANRGLSPNTFTFKGKERPFERSCANSLVIACDGKTDWNC